MTAIALIELCILFLPLITIYDSLECGGITNVNTNLFITPTIDFIASIHWDALKASRLKDLRGDDSMQALADRAGVSHQLIQRLEKNQVSPTSRSGKSPTLTWTTLEAICRGLSVSTTDFLDIQVVRVSKDFPKTY